MPKINGPYPHGSSYRLDIAGADGKKTTRTYASLQGAKIAKSRIEKSGQKTESQERGIDLPPWDGTLQWFLEAIASLTGKVASGAGGEARNDLKAISAAGMAAQKLFDTSDMEDQLKELEARVNEMRRLDKHGIRDIGQDQVAKSAARPN